MRQSLLFTVLTAAFSLASPAWALNLLATTTGNAAGDMLGSTVVDAGDLNGDGRHDYAVAATATDIGGNGSGSVYIFLGTFPPNGVPELTVNGVPGDLLGSALAAAGDLNDDGYDDLAIGSWRNGTNGSQAGKVLVLYGGNPPDNVPDHTLLGALAGGQFGRSLAGGNDLNGDGIADLAVGAPGLGTGSAYIFFGGDPFDTVSDLPLAGVDNAERFGIALASPGDLDGDLRADLAVGADQANVPATWAGAVRIFRGGPLLDSIADFTLTGEEGGNFFGGAVAPAGDVDGDGKNDLVVGAAGYNNGLFIDAGRAYLFRGGLGFDTTPDLAMTGLATEEQLGTAVAGGADLNRDGRDDLAIGVPGQGANRGVVRIFFGANPLNNTMDDSITGEATDNHLGQAVAVIADSDFNGAGEVLSGAWGYSSNTGRGYLHGDPSPPIAVEPLPQPALPFAVGSPRPNPAPAGVSLAITLDQARRVRCDVLDVSGRRLALLGDGELVAGPHAFSWDGRIDGNRAPAGVYLLRVSHDGGAVTRKLVLLP